MIVAIDHFVLTVQSLEVSLDFYERVLDMQRVVTAGRPTALAFGTQKINLHQFDHTFEPKAKLPTPAPPISPPSHRQPLGTVAVHLAAENVTIELKPDPAKAWRPRTDAARCISAIPTAIVEVSRYF